MSGVISSAAIGSLITSAATSLFRSGGSGGSSGGGATSPLLKAFNMGSTIMGGSGDAFADAKKQNESGGIDVLGALSMLTDKNARVTAMRENAANNTENIMDPAINPFIKILMNAKSAGSNTQPAAPAQSGYQPTKQPATMAMNSMGGQAARAGGGGTTLTNQDAIDPSAVALGRTLLLGR